jgi:tRNA (guanine-N7-)-methyltransferase
MQGGKRAHESGGPRSQRPIRSFVRREGRITPAQERAFAAHWPRYGLEYCARERDLNATFGRQMPRVMEIGFGNGEALIGSARQDPDRDYLGVEVHRPGVGRLLNALAASHLGNVRVYRHDAVEVLRDEIAPGALTELRIWFPDPWPKKRHHKRRLIQPAFVALAASRVAIGGRLHLATDWADYAEHMHEVLSATTAWRNLSPTGDYVARPPWRIATHFEQRGRKLGHRTWDLLHERI